MKNGSIILLAFLLIGIIFVSGCTGDENDKSSNINTKECADKTFNFYEACTIKDTGTEQAIFLNIEYSVELKDFEAEAIFEDGSTEKATFGGSTYTKDAEGIDKGLWIKKVSGGKKITSVKVIPETCSNLAKTIDCKYTT